MNRGKSILQFKITLLQTKLPVWRRILVPATYSFWDLHIAIQDAMGWQDYHLHAFRFADDPDYSKYIGIPDPEIDDIDVRASWEVKVADHLNTSGQSMQYEYDFGDGWLHEILLEDILTREKGVRYPQCVGGERACPPEDCGSIPGYEHIVHLMLKGPAAEEEPGEYQRLVEWATSPIITRYPPFSVGAFDIGRVRFDSPSRRLKEAFTPVPAPMRLLMNPGAPSGDSDGISDPAASAGTGEPFGLKVMTALLYDIYAGRLDEPELQRILASKNADEETTNSFLGILAELEAEREGRVSWKSSLNPDSLTPAIYQLKVTLMRSTPPIWRRILLPNTTELTDLHDIIQIAMGWEDSHLHDFTLDGYRFRDTDSDWDDTDDALPESDTAIGGLLRKPKDSLIYEYDFGDSWQHKVVLEKIRPFKNPDGTPAEGTMPLCTDGARNCPPEDVGGIWGYVDFLKAISDAEHPNHEEALEWIDGEFDPEWFSIDDVNAELNEFFRQE